ncbi:large subunit ribosomal protein L4 [Marchantia polymorpha subsp. ruderalis]|uniref:Large ribosomal subunit protein uL4c n=2 Tax=Marchantia polymorpha TaxID=3197 RepID=A0AAF6ARQ6_MARPO|nr:plastid ribosomal protein large subunit [Marchantia polymorpha]PTQ50203.1 hypothetical protein MARPO_0001s0232 [Marchantia polymorpha]BBM99126.1 hypothetical protein Mp_1g18940 [Marchantia polymorpha subsp. ruderalis]|eukprot:PTQ50203.1 hypothetical protein MARPO_0001s0232 [Marchantia polymorpha]
MASSCGAAATTMLAQSTAGLAALGFSASSVNVPTPAGFSGLRALAPLKKNALVAGRNAHKCAGVVMAAVAIPVITFDGASAGEQTISLKSARPETAGAVVHRGVITELQNRRRGTASTLTRSEVRGGGRKPFKQKGTGQARRGSQRTPLRPGGGVVFGPKPVDWRIKINKKEKQLAISTALQSAAVDALVVDDLETGLTAPKTKEFLAALKRWGVSPAQYSVIFTTEVSKELELSSRNIKTVKILTPRSLNLYDVLRADKLLFTKAGLEYLNNTYGAEDYADFEEGDIIETQAEDAATVADVE